MTPLERAARAACRAYIETEYDSDELDGLVRFLWREHVPSVRAVLLAIREPSEGMMKAGSALDIDLEWQSSDKAVPQIFTAMVDKALEEG